MPSSIPNPKPLYLFERPPWSSPWLWLALGPIILLLDRVTGFHFQFPVLFLVPVLLVAWHRRLRWAVLYALVLGGARFGLQFLHEDAGGLATTPVNAAVRVAVLILLAAMASRISILTRRLRLRVETLEGLLATCAHCKAIRDDKGKWVAIESYIACRTEAQFSHTVCPRCMKVHYADLFPEEQEN